MSPSKLAVAVTFGTALANPLTTIQPCPQATGLYPDVTVTEQHQPVSFCVPTSSAMEDGSYSTEYPLASTSAYLSTVIPCAWDGKSAYATTVTKADQDILCRQSASTITSVTPVKTGAPWKGKGRKHMTTSYSTAYETVYKRYYAPFSRLGGLAIPGYEGDEDCEDCGPQDDGSRTQGFNVTECHLKHNEKPKCSAYAETWVSKAAPSTSSVAQVACATQAPVAAAGTYTFTFPQVAPATTYTVPAQGDSPASTVTAAPSPWFAYVTTACDRATTFDFAVTVTKTIFLGMPYQTEAPTEKPVATSVGKEWGHWQPESTGSPNGAKGGNDYENGGWGNWPSSDPENVNGASAGASSDSWGNWASATNGAQNGNGASATNGPYNGKGESMGASTGTWGNWASATDGAHYGNGASATNGPHNAEEASMGASTGTWGNWASATNEPHYGNGASATDGPHYGNGASATDGPHYGNGASATNEPHYGNGASDATTGTWGNWASSSTSSVYNAPTSTTSMTSSMTTDMATSSMSSSMTSSSMTTDMATSSMSSSMTSSSMTTEMTTSSMTSSSMTTSDMTSMTTEMTTSSMSATSMTTPVITSMTTTSTTTGDVSVPTPTGDAFRIVVVANTNARFRKRALQYIGFNGEDAFIVGETGAAFFNFDTLQALVVGNLFVSSEPATQFVPLELTTIRPAVALFSVNAAGAIILSGSSGFCAVGDALFTVYASAPANCVPVLLFNSLIYDGAATTTTTTTTLATVTTTATATTTADPSADLDIADATATPTATLLRRGRPAIRRAM